VASCGAILVEISVDGVALIECYLSCNFRGIMGFEQAKHCTGRCWPSQGANTEDRPNPNPKKLPDQGIKRAGDGIRTRKTSLEGIGYSDAELR
jgi:hypothetical protein